MKQLNNFARSLWKDESAQGATEYILLLVVVVSVVMLFKEKIKTVLSSKLDSLSGDINSVNSNN